MSLELRQIACGPENLLLFLLLPPAQAFMAAGPAACSFHRLGLCFVAVQPSAAAGRLAAGGWEQPLYQEKARTGEPLGH